MCRPTCWPTRRWDRILNFYPNSNERLIEGVRKKDLDGEGAQEKEQI